MVRFARAEGSKASNKKELEEPTPWIEMISHLESNKKKRKKSKEEVESGSNDGTPGQGTKKDIGTGEQQIKPQNAFQAVRIQKTEELKEGNSLQTTPNAVKKNKKQKKKGAKPSEPEYTITPEGKRVKVFRDGTARTWFDLPYEESDAMTRYEGMWVKKVMVGELDRLKATLQEEGLDKKQIMKKMMKAKRKAHRELRIELIYQQKSLVSEATGEKGEDDSASRINVKEKRKNSRFTKKEKKQKPFMLDNGSWSSPHTESSIQTNQNKYNLVDEKNAEEVAHVEEQIIEDNDGEDEMETTMTLQACNKVQKKRQMDDTDGKIKKKSKMESGELEVTPSQVNGKDNDREQDDKVILASQGDVKVMKQNKSEKDKLETEILPSSINREDNDRDDKELTVTPQADGKVKKKNKSEKDRLQTEIVPSHINKEDSDGDDKEVTVTPQADGKTKKKKKKEDRLETEPEKSQIDIEDNKEDGEAEINESLTKKKEENYDWDSKKTDHTSSSQQGFEENELMTNYDGYWVLREDVESLESTKKMELEAIYAARTDESDTSKGELTQQEQLVLQRAMKKRKRFHHRKLLQRLSKMGEKVGDGKRKRGGKKEDDSGKVVKFDGFWVKKEAADRLHKLRKKFFSEGLSQQEVDALIQKERRKEERVLKNERKLVCLNCRQPGHMVSACPNIVQAEGEGQPSICYTCGSTEHTSSSCNLKKGSEKSFSFATCYICGETGHISRQCPDNPRGLYPKGGACRGCGSVEHLAKDCPDLQKEKEESSLRVGRLKGEELEALDADQDETGDQDVSSTHNKWDRPKVVKF